jgi:hypothetical protein
VERRMTMMNIQMKVEAEYEAKEMAAARRRSVEMNAPRDFAEVDEKIKRRETALHVLEGIKAELVSLNPPPGQSFREVAYHEDVKAGIQMLDGTYAFTYGANAASEILLEKLAPFGFPPPYKWHPSPNNLCEGSIRGLKGLLETDRKRREGIVAQMLSVGLPAPAGYTPPVDETVVEDLRSA